jgi:hypothetical protein
VSYAALVAERRGGPPPILDIRFDAQRRALPEPGNTVIGHASAPVRDALTAARDRLAAAPGGETLAWLPPSSYHMTIFDGLLHRRREAGYWPPFLSVKATEAEADAFVFARLSPLRPDAPSLPFRMTLQALGLTDRPGHEDYTFHITLAYAIAWPDGAAARTFGAALWEADAALRLEAPTFEIGPPELCRFRDMTRFEVVETLC